MTDIHVHIGQFCETYYAPHDIAQIVFDCGIEEAVISSTSSCKVDVEYAEVEREITALLARYPSVKLKALLWYIPAYAADGISIAEVMSSVPYSGFKLHPRAHRWDMSNTEHLHALHNLFGYAHENELPVLIHTGYDHIDEAHTFRRLLGEYPKAQCIFAHARPFEQTLSLMSAYQNAYCDTAFVTESDVKQFVAHGFGEKIILGSDFPITHYFGNKQRENFGSEKMALKEQYTKDVTQLQMYQNIISG